MKKVSKILCATDGSAFGLEAAESAHSLARTLGARLTVLHVAPLRVVDLMGPKGSMGGEDIFPSQLEKRLAEHAEMVTQAVADKLQDPEVEYERRLGHPGDTICHFAREGNFDLIVVGSQGQSGLKRMLLGSVSDYVAHNSHCPVLIVKD